MTHLSQCRRLGVPSLGQEDPLEGEIATTLLFLLGNCQGQKSLTDYSPCKESTGLSMHVHGHVRSHVRTAEQLSPWATTEPAL